MKRVKGRIAIPPDEESAGQTRRSVGRRPGPRRRTACLSIAGTRAAQDVCKARNNKWSPSRWDEAAGFTGCDKAATEEDGNCRHR